MFDEDLSEFFDTEDGFAVEAAVTRGGEPVATVAGNFNEPSKALSIEGTDVEEKQAFILAPATAIAGVKRKDVCTIAGDSYVIERIHPDGTGLVLIYLAER